LRRPRLSAAESRHSTSGQHYCLRCAYQAGAEKRSVMLPEA
jgi:hypothetical protein